jgi:hypothetical protein
MSGLTNVQATAYVADSLGVSVRVAPVAPMKLAAETTAGTTTAAGTELASTTRPTVTFGAPTGTPPVASNTVACTVVAGAGGTVVAEAVWDSATTPVRFWWGPLASARTVVTGDSLAFAIGAITASLTS